MFTSRKILPNHHSDMRFSLATLLTEMFCQRQKTKNERMVFRNIIIFTRKRKTIKKKSKYIMTWVKILSSICAAAVPLYHPSLTQPKFFFIFICVKS